MGMLYAEAKALEEKAREAVARQVIARDEARKEYEDAQKSLHDAEDRRVAAREAIEDLQARLRLTRDAIMPNEAASKRARMEHESTCEALAKAHEQRISAEKELVELEARRDEAASLLDGAEEDMEKSGENETSSRIGLDERVQRATDAQRALDAALQGIEDGKKTVAIAENELQKALDAESSLPRDDDPLERVVEQKKEKLDKVMAASRSAAEELSELRQNHQRAEKEAKEAKKAYEKAQENLRTAIAAADRAESRMRVVQQRAEIDEADRQLQVEVLSDYTATQDLKSAAMTVNAEALTRLADADVESIRIRIACDQASAKLDASNAACARAERELREAREAVERAQSERRESLDEVRVKREQLKLAKEDLVRLEALGEEAAEENATAQKGLRDMQEMAVRYGKESRDAADVVDDCRHELSTVVSAIETARTQLAELKQMEEECAARVEAAYVVRMNANKELEEAHAFIGSAEKDIERQREAMENAEKDMVEMSERFRKADDAYSKAQRELEVANADLTDAEVSVIMAEIDERL